MPVDGRVPGFLGRVLDEVGEPIGTCFQIADRVVVTAWHVLDDLGAGDIDVVVRIDPLRGGEPTDARVTAVDALHDLAVLTLTTPLPVSTSGLAATDEVNLTEPVSITGVPKVTDRYAYRHLDAPGRWAGGTTRNSDIPLGRLTADAVMKGMSGAPVLNASGVVVGVVSGRYNTEDGWLRDSVWVARTENLMPLLDGLLDMTLTARAEASSDGSEVHIATIDPVGQLGNRLVYGDIPARPIEYQDRSESIRLTSGKLQSNNTPPIYVIAGGRGVGKTQVAAEHVRLCAREGYDIIAWVPGDDEDVLVSNFAQIARQLGISSSSNDSRLAAIMLKNFLSVTDRRSLLIIDNANDPQTVRNWIPAVGSAVILVTTTNHELGKVGQLIGLSVFDRTQSFRYLSARTGLRADSDSEASTIASKLGDLPLALAQAASVMNYYRIDYCKYSKRLDAVSVADALPSMPGDQYPIGAAQAILLAIEAVEHRHDKTAVRRVLNSISVISSGGAGRSLLGRLLGVGFGWAGFKKKLEDDENYILAMEILPFLVSMSILQWDESGRAVIMHRLVGRVVRDRMAALRTFPAIAASMARALPSVIVEDHHECIEHALGLWASLKEKSIQLPNPPASFADCAPLASWAISRLIRVPDLPRAVDFAESAFNHARTVFGDLDASALRLRDSLLTALRHAGTFDRALSLLLEIAAEQAARPDALPYLLQTRSQIGVTYSWQGNHTDAVQIHKDVLTQLRFRRDDGVERLRAQDMLASSYFIMGEPGPAVVLLESNLDSAQRRRAISKPDRVWCGRKMAAGYLISEDADAADVLYRDYLEIDRNSQTQDFFPNTDSIMGRVQEAVLNYAISELESERGPVGPIDLSADFDLLPDSMFRQAMSFLDQNPQLATLYTLDGVGRTAI